ncbi:MULTISPECIES: hypothetical protein [Citrobacter freundii complex]|uniref:Uncharacterized protein n=1 Tax=Citrobacter braakii TaxID=57706 RepID=A0A1V8NSB7_CITBR|nr:MULTISPECIES: hypothetical protein [Citrobacter freundii complex]OPW96031.1 hypothetical protein BZK41_13670 [Citrobacter sp. A316]OQM39294.1 hypothetical protein BZK42_25380 [Citrobacter braakii]QXC18110.1 hypothetical protein I6L51_08635 [Citrobacter braakii]
MTEHSYPHDYLPLPLMDNYGFQAASPLLRTEMVSGRARQRRRYTSTPTVATVNWTFTTNPQAMLFEAWYRDVLKDGANWFMMQLQTPLGDLQWFKCRFTDIYQGPTLVAPRYWRYSATLELWSRAVLDGGYGEYPDFIRNSDIIDRAMNREWPET